MNFRETLKEAWSSLRKNPLRSSLAMLGVIIGVAAVALMLAVGDTTRREVDRSIAAMGSNILIVLSGTTTSGGLRVAAGSAPTLTVADVEALGKLPEALGAAGVHPATAQVINGATNWSTVVNGVTRDYFLLREWKTVCGTVFDEADHVTANNYIILGGTIVTALFGSRSACGQTVRISGSPFLVIGVLENKGQTLDGRDQDDAVFMPLHVFHGKILGGNFPDTLRYVGVKARALGDMALLEEEVSRLLRQRHRLRDDAEPDFSVRNLMSVAQTAMNAARAMTAMLGALGSISLIVGGIGIMNIMFVTVNERSREIGLRMAVGATRRAIMMQFLVESVLICVMGGVFGAVLALLGAWIVASHLGVTVEITVLSLLFSGSFALVVGIVFGWWPAWKAACLTPADALRME